MAAADEVGLKTGAGLQDHLREPLPEENADEGRVSFYDMVSVFFEGRGSR